MYFLSNSLSFAAWCTDSGFHINHPRKGMLARIFVKNLFTKVSMEIHMKSLVQNMAWLHFLLLSTMERKAVLE